MQSEPMLDDTTPPAIDEAPFGEEHPNGRAPLRLVLYELAVSVPLVLWIVLNVFHHPQDFASPMLLVWAVGIAVVDLMPLPHAPAWQHFESPRCCFYKQKVRP